MKSMTALATLATIATAGLAHAAPASAAVTSASRDAATVTLNLDAADDNVTVSVASGMLIHNAAGAGLNSALDWDSATPGDQTAAADGTFTVVVDGGDGNDALTVLAKNTEIAHATLNGAGGDDVLTGADSADTLNGGDGNDRLVGAQGSDVANGGNGNDTLVWNNGDGSDTLNGDAGNDGVEVNGAPAAGDAFTLAANAGRVQFRRTNLGPFSLDASAERFQVNGLGGNDSLTAADGVGALTLLSVDGGAGADTITGGGGPDVIAGGEGNDVLSGGGGDDRIAGDRGNDTMNGGAGDDTLVWNNGDGSDVVNGDDGRDDVEVNGAPTAGDAFTVNPSGDRIRFDRTNLVPFSLDIGSSETMHANGLGGDDVIAVGEVGGFGVTASGGAGNDTLTGASSSETFLGGSGDDAITPGGGLDVVFGDDGDDQVNVRDNTPDVAFGGAGNDAVLADGARLDVLDAFEAVDRTPDTTATATLPVSIRGGTVRVSKRVAPLEVSCPAGAPGRCTGTLSLRTAQRVRVSGRNAVLQLGSARFDIAPGASKTVRVRLAGNVGRLTDRHGRVKVLATASTGPAGQVVESSRRLTLALRAQAKAGYATR